LREVELIRHHVSPAVSGSGSPASRREAVCRQFIKKVIGKGAENLNKKRGPAGPEVG